MKKIAITGFMASIMMASGAAMADITSLTTKGYVDDGLRAVYSVAKGAADDVADLETEVSVHDSAISTLQSNLTTEAGARESADSAINAKIGSTSIGVEGTTITGAIKTLQDTVGGLDGTEYTGTNGVTVSGHSVELALPENPVAGASYVYKPGTGPGTGWTALSVEDTWDASILNQ